MPLALVKETPSSWRLIQKQNFTRLSELADFLELDPESRAKLLDQPRFVLNLPRRLAQKMAKNDLQDPLFRQFVPLKEELLSTPGFMADPVCDLSFRAGPRLLHKYESRVLLVTTSACAMHCRYCFRQNFPYESGFSDLSSDLAYIQNNPAIEEVILSGGDPLSLSNETLQRYFEAFASIPHLKRIRFHTRFPIGIPERIDEPFLQLLSSCPQQIVFILHCNHPRELDSDVLQAMQQIKKRGIHLLNQSVLLKGVNDDEETFLALCQSLVNGGILPYYLHLLDPVQGSAHFHVPEERGQTLIQYVQKRLSGYAVPRLVREEPGQESKTFLA